MSRAWFDALTGGKDIQSPSALYHENSKLRRRSGTPDEHAEPETAAFAYHGYPAFALGEGATANSTSAGRELVRRDLAQMLRNAASDAFVEVYVHAAAVADLPPGLYHHDRARDAVVQLTPGDESEALAAAGLGKTAASIFLVGALARAARLHGERGYRYALISAGGVRERLRSAAVTIGLATRDTDGYFDRDIDRLLGLDGVDMSILCILSVDPASES